MKANEAQTAPEWLQKRAGCFTASRASDLMAQGRGGAPSATRGALLVNLALERIVGATESYQNDAMRRGQELEGEARDAYGFERGIAVDEADFIPHESIPFCGCSPDGLVGDDGMLEIKCPANPAKHLDALRKGSHAVEYRWQLQHQLMVTGRAWVDCVSYDPRFPSNLQLAITRVERDETAIKQLIEAIETAETEVAAIVDEINTRSKAA